MSQLISDRAAAPLAMEANYVSYFAGLARAPQLQFRQDARLTILTSRRLPNWNTILRTNLMGRSAVVQVAEVLTEFKSHGQSFVWQLLPSARPLDLRSYLLAARLEPSAGRPHMLADLSELSAEFESPPGLNIQLVRDKASFAPWYAATMAGFESSPPQARLYHDAYLKIGFGPRSNFLHFVGFAANQPATSSTLVLSDGIAGIFDVSTVPAFRRRGYGAAITLAAMYEARQRGYRFATLQSASDEAASIYRRLGFVEQYQEENFRFTL